MPRELFYHSVAIVASNCANKSNHLYWSAAAAARDATQVHIMQCNWILRRVFIRYRLIPYSCGYEI